MTNNIRKSNILLQNKNNDLKQEDIFVSFLNNNDVKEKNIYYQYGFRYLGILLFSFSVWLKNNLTNKKIKDVFFLSRDGFLMKNVFDAIYISSDIKTHYLYVSRRSLNVPNLWKQPDFDFLDNNISMSNYFTINTFIKRIGLIPDKYEKKYKEFHISKTEEFSLKTFKNDDRLKKFYNSIINDVINNSKKEHKELIGYLKQENFKGNVAIVDIGWHGSMQKNINKICHDISSNINITGYYFGQEKIVKNGNGFLFNELDNLDYKYTIAGSFGFFESLFLAKHGTVLKYSNSKGIIEPVLDKYEFSSKDVNANIVVEIQKGAIDFCKLFAENKTIMDNDFSSISFLPIKRLCVMPTLSEIKLFKNIMFNDTKNERLIDNKSLIYYLFHLKTFINDFYKSVWKMGFVKSTFKLPLPYYKVYSFMKRKEKNEE